MQAKKKTVALIEPAAGNVDASYQKSILTRYAENNKFEIDQTYGERAPLAGTPGETEYADLLNDIKDGGVGLLLALEDVRHSLPREILDACRDAGVKVKFVDTQQERGLSQTT
ncbi:MAG TPA: hypothetical protein VNN73_01375 [Blastocatellia bacterium]|nr:hypothetical protein [Blastocatellia bacterium]